MPNKEITAQRAVSRLRRRNDRSVPSIHEDHEDDENAENGVVQRSQKGLIISALFIYDSKNPIEL
ncbi:MAG: hypothetical protein KGO93_00320 [Cyanobacteria bacterium REEB446]|nr:hypothetical protein [Cyanobacteria bacterium REEB446]